MEGSVVLNGANDDHDDEGDDAGDDDSCSRYDKTRPRNHLDDDDRKSTHSNVSSLTFASEPNANLALLAKRLFTANSRQPLQPPPQQTSPPKQASQLQLLQQPVQQQQQQQQQHQAVKQQAWSVNLASVASSFTPPVKLSVVEQCRQAHSSTARSLFAPDSQQQPPTTDNHRNDYGQEAASCDDYFLSYAASAVRSRHALQQEEEENSHNDGDGADDDDDDERAGSVLSLPSEIRADCVPMGARGALLADPNAFNRLLSRVASHQPAAAAAAVAATSLVQQGQRTVAHSNASESSGPFSWSSSVTCAFSRPQHLSSRISSNDRSPQHSSSLLEEAAGDDEYIAQHRHYRLEEENDDEEEEEEEEEAREDDERQDNQAPDSPADDQKILDEFIDEVFPHLVDGEGGEEKENDVSHERFAYADEEYHDNYEEVQCARGEEEEGEEPREDRFGEEDEDQFNGEIEEPVFSVVAANRPVQLPKIDEEDEEDHEDESAKKQADTQLPANSSKAAAFRRLSISRTVSTNCQPKEATKQQQQQQAPQTKQPVVIQMTRTTMLRLAKQETQRNNSSSSSNNNNGALTISQPTKRPTSSGTTSATSKQAYSAGATSSCTRPAKKPMSTAPLVSSATKSSISSSSASSSQRNLSGSTVLVTSNLHPNAFNFNSSRRL